MPARSSVAVTTTGLLGGVMDLLMLEWQNRGLNLWTAQRCYADSDRRHVVIRPDL